VYSRRLDDKVLRFGHEGVLYRNSFIMYDHETDTKWIHTTGQAIKGKLKGKQLTFLPATITTWGAWRKQHPKTSVLIGGKAHGFMGTFSAKRSPNRYGLSLGSGKSVKIYPYSILAKNPIVLDSFGGQSVVVVYDAPSVTAVAFKTGDHKFTAAGQDKHGRRLMTDDATGSHWLAVNGECLVGELKGTRLVQLPATPWLIRRWRGFYPKSPTYKK